MRCLRKSIPLPASQEYGKGAALLPCVLLLLVVLMMETASLVLSRNLRSMAQAHAGRELARHAAEAALADGRLHLMMMDDPLSTAVSGVSHEFGTVTGARYPAAPGMNAVPSPVYRIERLSATGRSVISRVSATGWGTRQTMRLSLQADYAVTVCDTQAEVAGQPDEQNGEHTHPQRPEEATGDTPAPTSCKRSVRLLGWRELDSD
jgi:Tfp pilus assembly protein PilX